MDNDESVAVGHIVAIIACCALGAILKTRVSEVFLGEALGLALSGLAIVIGWRAKRRGQSGLGLGIFAGASIVLFAMLLGDLLFTLILTWYQGELDVLGLLVLFVSYVLFVSTIVVALWQMSERIRPKNFVGDSVVVG